MDSNQAEQTINMTIHPTTYTSALKDPDWVWDAIGINSVSYPFDDSRYNKTDAQRKEIRGMVNEYDSAIAARIGELIATGDDTELGQLIREQVEAFAKNTTVL